MSYTAGFSVNVGDPTKASDVTTLAANDDYLKTAVDKIMADAATPSFALRDGVTATTQSSGNNSPKLATTAYADAASISFANDANNRVVTGTGSGLNGEANLTFDGSTLTVTGALSATGNVSFDGGSFTFNESGADKDFRIEGDTEQNLFVADASTDRIGIGTATPTDKFSVHFTASSMVEGLVLYNKATDGNGPAIRFESDYGSSRKIHSAINGNADGSGGALSFHTSPDNASTGSLVRHMILKPDGKLGLGVSNPSAALELYRDDTAVSDQIRISQDGTGDAAMMFHLSGTQGWYAGIDNSAGDIFYINTGEGNTSSGINISTAGWFSYGNAGHSRFKTGSQFTSGIATSAVTIMSTANAGGANSALAVAQGRSEADGTRYFLDMVCYSPARTGTVTVISSNSNVDGAASMAGRTYTNVDGNLKLAMASGSGVTCNAWILGGAGG